MTQQELSAIEKANIPRTCVLMQGGGHEVEVTRIDLSTDDYERTDIVDWGLLRGGAEAVLLWLLLYRRDVPCLQISVLTP